MKIFKWIVIAVVLLLVIGVVVLYANLNHIVKRTVETQGSEQLKVPTTLDGVSLGMSKLANIPAEVNLTIPSIDVKNIGNADGANNGAAIKDVVSTLITQMAAKAAESDKLPPEVRAVLSGNLDAVKDKLTAAANAELQKVTGKLTDELKSKLPAGIP